MPTKPFSPVTTPRLPSHTAARNAALVNLLATPGLGSLMARRWVAGVGQLVLALAGFGMLLAWFVRTMRDYYGMISDQQSAPQVHFGLLKVGAAVFAVSWLWALVTSFQIFRSVPKNLPGVPPPRLG